MRSRGEHIGAAAACAAIALCVALGCAAVSFASPVSARAVPYLQYSPPMPRTGQLLTLYGRGFCAATACSRITVTMDGRWVARAFRPYASGRFVLTFRLTQAMGPHLLRASQRDGAGRLRSAAVRIVLGPSGHE